MKILAPIEYPPPSLHPHNPIAGKAKYDPKRGALVWKLKKFAGDAEQSLSASVELIATTREKQQWSRPPVSMSFSVREGLCLVVIDAILIGVYGRCVNCATSSLQHAPRPSHHPLYHLLLSLL